MTLITSLFSIAPMISILTMVIQRNHILMSLLALEGMILTIALLTILYTSFINPMQMFLTLIILTFGACEASLGLACLVSMARTYGNDSISSSNISKC